MTSQGWRSTLALVAVLCLPSAPANAQVASFVAREDASPAPGGSRPAGSGDTSRRTGDLSADLRERPPMAPAGNMVASTPPATRVDRRPWPAAPPAPARPPGLLALYAGFATLQALDAYSTLAAVRAGHREANPLVAPFSRQPAAMFALKAATTTVTILAVEKLRRRNRGAAVGLMIAANLAYGAIVAHNYRSLR